MASSVNEYFDIIVLHHHVPFYISRSSTFLSNMHTGVIIRLVRWTNQSVSHSSLIHKWWLPCIVLSIWPTTTSRNGLLHSVKSCKQIFPSSAHSNSLFHWFHSNPSFHHGVYASVNCNIVFCQLYKNWLYPIYNRLIIDCLTVYVLTVHYVMFVLS